MGVQLGPHGGGVLVVELGELGLDAGGDGDDPGPLGGGVGGDLGGHVERALVDVGEEEHGLGGERTEVAGGPGGLLGEGHGAHGAPGLEGGDDAVQPGLFGDGDAVPAAGVFGDALDAPFGLLEVGEGELGLDGLDVAQGIDVALGVDDALIAVDADDVDEGVGLADVGEEAVAETLALVGAGDEAGDVVEVDGVVDELGGAEGGGNPLETGVEDGHDGDVGLDRGEGVVGGLGAGFGERVEE